MAGHETSANAMAWAWFLLSQAPDAAARVRAEAIAALDGRAAGWADLPNLPFARAVVEETLRLYPPVPLLARAASAPLEIGGHRVPRGGLVLAVPWLLHRNPRLWEEPDRFAPERFLHGQRPPRHAYIPVQPRAARLHRGAIRARRDGDLPGDPGAALRPAARARRARDAGVPADPAAGRGAAHAARPRRSGALGRQPAAPIIPAGRPSPR